MRDWTEIVADTANTIAELICIGVFLLAVAVAVGGLQ